MDTQLSNKSVRFMDSSQYLKHYGSIKVMHEGFVSDPNDNAVNYWHRECCVIADEDINKFKGKTLGNHKLSLADKIKKVNIKLGGTDSGISSENDTERLVKLYEQFGTEIVDRALSEVSGKKEGSVVIIRKDRNLGTRTKKHRYRGIQSAMHYAESASVGQGNLSFSELMDGERMEITTAVFAEKFQTEFGDHIEVDTKTEPFEIFLRESSMSWKPNKMSETRLRFLLRWNEWLKFEHVVNQNTLDGYPTEWDSLVGKIWTMCCGTDKRFGELDRELVIVNGNTGKPILVNGVPIKFGVDNNLDIARVNSNKMMKESIKNAALPV